MKLLFDQILSPQLGHLLAAEFPGSAHVRDYALARAADPLVWAHAATHGLAIVSKDADFQQRALLLGPPPKIVWVRLGNCLTSDVATLLRSHTRLCWHLKVTQRRRSSPLDKFLASHSSTLARRTACA